MLEKNRIRERMRAERRKVAPSVRRSASQAVCARILDRADVKGALAAKQPFAVYLASPQEIDLAPLVKHLWAAGCPVLVPAWRNGSYALVSYSQKTKLISGPMGILEPAPQGSVPSDSEPAPEGSVPNDFVMLQSWRRHHGKTVRNYGDTDSPSKDTDSPSKIEGVAGGRGSMTGDGIIPPCPSGALPLSQGESLTYHPQLCDITTDSGSVPKVWIVPGLAFTRTGARLGYGGGWYDRLLAGADPSAVLLGVAYPFQMVEELPSELHDIRLTDVVVAEGCI